MEKQKGSGLSTGTLRAKNWLPAARMALLLFGMLKLVASL
jgi:hypothetical protein